MKTIQPKDYVMKTVQVMKSVNVFCRSAMLLVSATVWAGAAGADYVQEVGNDKPLGWWRFDDQAGTTGAIARDQVGVHAGTYHGGVALEADGPFTGSKAATFDGKSYVEVPHHADFALNTLSVEFWFKSTQAWDQPYWPGSAALVSKATAGGGSGDWTILGGSTTAGGNQGRIIAASGPSGGNRDQVLPSQGRLNNGKWHHVVWTRSDNGACTLYVDGRVAGEANDGGLAITNTRPIQLGGEALLEGGKHLQGSLAEVAIYPTALGVKRVQAHYVAAFPNATLPPEEVAGDAYEKPAEQIVLTNKAGLRWELERRAGGWSLGRVFLHEKPVDRALSQGVICLRQTDMDEDLWLPAAEARQIDGRTARLSGERSVDGAMFRFEVEVSLGEDMPEAALIPRWSVDRDIDGWEVALAYHGVGESDWRCTHYPFAGNSEQVAITPMRYCGIPGVLMFRPDLSMVALLAIDSRSDYLNPTTWTGSTAFHFANRSVSPQFRIGGGKLAAGTKYELPMQLFISDAGESAKAITGLVKSWIALNQYAVEPLKVRSHQEGFDLFLQGRTKGAMWREGLGYQIMENWKVVYTAESPLNAWFDYLLYEETGDPMWRKRVFDAMDLVLKAQHTDPADPYFGALETNYELDTKTINSNDHTDNWHYKVDMNSFAARYMLQVWQRVKEKEGIDRKDWYQCAVRMADWVMKQQNPDGGLPQVVDDKQNRKSISVISGRSLTAFPIIHRITGEEKYGKFASQLEKFLRTHVEDRYWFTGAHVDLYPGDFEADSVWHAVEYWIDKYDQTKDKDCLRRAEADAWFAFLMLCPKQLSWVKNPTQTCHTEQQRFLQYSNYCYNNRKYYCLARLAKLTGEKLFGDLCERIIQCGFWAQPASGPWVGGINERMCDPWKALSGDFNSMAQVYTGELATDAALQLLEMGLAKPGNKPLDLNHDAPRGK
ncbi:MAG: LamG domain-containing protein [Verrucomicrobia bacterium]|nr:LamG domain-containing protein [Verrucomicrobiota bacterium]